MKGGWRGPFLGASLNVLFDMLTLYFLLYFRLFSCPLYMAVNQPITPVDMGVDRLEMPVFRRKMVKNTILAKLQ